FVAKDEHGEITEIRASDLTQEDAALFGTLAGGLFGFGAGGPQGLEIGAEIGLLAGAAGGFGLSEENMDEIADLIPMGSSAAFILLEHLWAVGLKEGVLNADGRLIAHGWITPETLVKMGIEASEDEE